MQYIVVITICDLVKERLQFSKIAFPLLLAAEELNPERVSVVYWSIRYSLELVTSVESVLLDVLSLYFHLEQPT